MNGMSTKMYQSETEWESRCGFESRLRYSPTLTHHTMRLLNLSLAIVFCLLGIWASYVALREGRNDQAAIGFMCFAMACALTFLDRNKDEEDYLL